MQEKVLRVIFLIMGLMLIGIGGSLFVHSNLGSDPFNVLAQGGSKFLNVSVGTMNSILSFGLFIVVLVCSRKDIKLGTILAVLIIGSVMNFWSFIFAPFFVTASLLVRIIAVILGPIVIGIGVAMVQVADIGMVPNDIVPLLIYKKLGKYQYRTVRIAYDFSEFLIGFLLGGIIGIGTIIAAIITGVMIQYSLPYVEKAFFSVRQTA